MEAQYWQIRKDYQDFLTTVFSLAHLTDTVDLAQKIVDFEQSIAHAILADILSAHIDSHYHIFSLTELQQIVPSFELNHFIAGAKISEHKLQQIVVSYPSYLTEFARLWSQQSIDFLGKWIKVNILVQIWIISRNVFGRRNLRFMI